MDNKEKENVGISLLKKGKKGLFSAVFSRLGLIILLLAVQVLFFVGVLVWFEEFLPHIYSISMLFASFMALFLLNSHLDASAKITWLVIIMLLPVFGALLYVYTQRDIGHRTLKKHVNQLIETTKDAIPQSEDTLKKLQEEAPGVASLANYIKRDGCFPVYEHTDVTYFPIGEKKFEAMLKELEKAKKFIFLEYFIVDEGIMWGSILEILAKKAAEGVDVRMMYDGTCEFSTLPHDYPKRLEKLGIRCKAFAPLTPFVSTHYNYRDHRKILVIDGQVAFNGGINLADEYINAYEKHGHWKDTAVMLKGEAVRSFTLMFLQMWGLDEKNPDFSPVDEPVLPPETIADNGFVIPYGDCPLDRDKVGEQVYMDILNRATKYVHIMTPYLILDGELENALEFAAERGVDVRIILPGVADKNTPFALAYTHYAGLLEAGVKIYEYTPGFVHAKVVFADDTDAVVGTINFDYRSLYHHFECATLMHKTSCITDISADFDDTLTKCKQITKDNLKQIKTSRKVLGFLMKVVAPLM